MNTAIVVLLFCELAFMVWRDWDHRLYRQSLEELADSFESNRRVLVSNAYNARKDAEYWREIARTKTDSSPAETGK